MRTFCPESPHCLHINVHCFTLPSQCDHRHAEGTLSTRENLEECLSSLRVIWLFQIKKNVKNEVPSLSLHDISGVTSLFLVRTSGTFKVIKFNRPRILKDLHWTTTYLICDDFMFFFGLSHRWGSDVKIFVLFTLSLFISCVDSAAELPDSVAYQTIPYGCRQAHYPARL